MANNIPPLTNMHHMAFRCRDAEETRAFYEDVLGLKLAAALDFDHISGTDEEYLYMHLFFELGDGNFIAFFDVPSDVNEDMFKAKWGMDLHFAFEVETEAEMEAFRKRLDDHGVQYFGPINHDFVHSIYFYDPNGLNLEITRKDAKHNEILDHETETAHDAIKAWTEKTRELKEKANLKMPMAAE